MSVDDVTGGGAVPGGKVTAVSGRDVVGIGGPVLQGPMVDPGSFRVPVPSDDVPASDEVAVESPVQPHVLNTISLQ